VELDVEFEMAEGEQKPRYGLMNEFGIRIRSPYNYVEKEPDLITWGPHILRSRGWVAQAHMTFMYWWMNMTQRIKALSAKKWFVRDNPKSTGYTAEDLKGMGVRGLARCKIHDIIDFFAQYVSEWNPNKDKQGNATASHVAERVNEAQEHTAAVSIEDMLRLLQADRSHDTPCVRIAYYMDSNRT
jgi:hypothetical protein